MKHISSSSRPLVVGTRGSALALRQAMTIARALRRRHPDLAVEVREIRTRGDVESGASLQAIGGQGVFVTEIEEALLGGTIDLAVHSLKDLPGTLATGLTLAAIPHRADARDVVVARSGARLMDLPPGATVGTGSARRAAQIRALRPDLAIADLRGNVDTRLRKALDPHGPYDAVVLALAGLRRLRRDRAATEILPFDTMLPAPGQGALGLEIRADDVWTCDLVAPLDHPQTAAAVIAERGFLKGLGGGCQAPIAALGRVRGARLWLTGLVVTPAGAVARRVTQGAVADAEAVGLALAAAMRDEFLLATSRK